MIDIGQEPFDELMEKHGYEHRCNILMGLIINPNSSLLPYSLKKADDWFRAHGIDPETIQLWPSEIEAAKKRKKELDAFKAEARAKAARHRVLLPFFIDFSRF